MKMTVRLSFFPKGLLPSRPQTNLEDGLAFYFCQLSLSFLSFFPSLLSSLPFSFLPFLPSFLSSLLSRPQRKFHFHLLFSAVCFSSHFESSCSSPFSPTSSSSLLSFPLVFLLVPWLLLPGALLYRCRNARPRRPPSPKARENVPDRRHKASGSFHFE
jgi:hypothetical protein